MTKEEIIDGLYRGDSKAIKEAIKALEQQPYEEDVQRVVDYLLKPINKSTTSEDCVSRQAVVEYIKASGAELGHDSENEIVVEDILNMPPVTPTQKWIPVSERLPEEDGEYLLFGKIDEDEENYIFIGEFDTCGEQFGIWLEQFDRTTLGCLGSEFFEYSSVIAWQPLPKPYEEKRGSENDNN